MLATDGKRLESILVQLLAEQPGATASELQQLIETKHRSCSIQGTYQELRKLQQAGVVLKVGENYSIALAWAFDLVGLADRVYDNYIESASRLEIIPEHQSSKTWKFNNLLKLDDLWVQAMIAVFHHSRSKCVYNWAAHPWYYFAQMDKVKQFYKLFEQENWQYYSTIGGTTFLDQYYAESMPDYYHYRLGVAPVFENPSKYHSIIGDYMFTVKLDLPTTERIERLFQSVRSIDDTKYHTVFPMLNTKGRLSLKIEHNPKKIGGYVRKFRRYFGLPIGQSA